MKLIEINWHPTDRQLRQFAVISLVALPLAAWMGKASLPVIAALGTCGAVLAVIGCLVPQVLKPVFLALMLVSLPIGLVVGEVALCLIYFGVFLPMGQMFRIMGRDSLQLKFDRQATTYWRAKAQPRGPSTYYRQS